MRKLGRCDRAQPPGLDSLEHRAGLPQGNVWVDGRIDGPMHRHQVVHTYELVQLDVVHMPVLSSFRRMQDDKDVIVVGVHLRDPITLHGVRHSQWVKPEHIREHTHRLLVPGGDVHPHETVLTLKQLRQLVDATLLNPTLSRRRTSIRPTSLSRAAALCGFASALQPPAARPC